MSVEDAVKIAVTEMVEALNRADMAVARTCFANGAVIVEDIAPFRWAGPDGVSNWLEVVAGVAERRGVDARSMTLGSPTRTEVEGENAYILFPGCLTIRTGGGALSTEGLLTFTLTAGEDRWLINTLAWSVPNPKLGEPSS